jgi:exopolyphosphatase / guanosine-5'-triphosphate,3'-diphosphate pyrophosphatase
MINFFSINSNTSLVKKAATRAAFDIGSGKFKLLVADFYRENKIEEKFSKIVRVSLAKDLANSADNHLSESIKKKAMAALEELQNDAQSYGASQCQGVATAVFRKAKNGEAFLNSLQNKNPSQNHISTG